MITQVQEVRSTIAVEVLQEHASSSHHGAKISVSLARCLYIFQIITFIGKTLQFCIVMLKAIAKSNSPVFWWNILMKHWDRVHDFVWMHIWQNNGCFCFSFGFCVLLMSVNTLSPFWNIWEHEVALGALDINRKYALGYFLDTHSTYSYTHLPVHPLVCLGRWVEARRYPCSFEKNMQISIQ